MLFRRNQRVLILPVAADQAGIGRPESVMLGLSSAAVKWLSPVSTETTPLAPANTSATCCRLSFGSTSTCEKPSANRSALMFMLCTPRQFDLQPAVGRQRDQLAPVLLRPVLVVTRRRVQKHQILPGIGRRAAEKARGDGVIAVAARFVVTEAFGEQLTRAFHRVLLFVYLMAHVVEPAGERLARALAVRAMFVAFGDARDQRGAFDQALSVDHYVVTAFLQRALEVAALLSGVVAEPVLAPAANGHRDHAIHRRVPGGDLAEAFFHYPVEADIGNGLQRIGQGGQGMQHVSHRGRFTINTCMTIPRWRQATASAHPTLAAAEYRSNFGDTLFGIALTHLVVAADQADNPRLVGERRREVGAAWAVQGYQRFVQRCGNVH